MDNLEETFGEQIIQAKTDAIKDLINCKQKVRTPIKEHMMKIMAYLSEAQANGAEIYAATQLVIVFQTLSKDFNLFQASYNLNWKKMSLTELMKKLQAFENILKGSGVGIYMCPKDRKSIFWIFCKYDIFDINKRKLFMFNK